MKTAFSSCSGLGDRKQMFVPDKYQLHTPRLGWRIFAALLGLFLSVVVARAGTVTNGYICAVLRSQCTSDPVPPPPVGSTRVGPDYVIMTIADASPTNWVYAQQVATDAIFESLMPLYCALIGTANNCVTDSVQWNIITYDANGNPLTSGCAASGCQLHSCPGPTVTNGYICAVLRSECASAPTPPPPVGSTRVGTNYVIMTIADASPTNWVYAQQVATDAIFESLMPLYCALPETTNNCVTDSVQWNIITYNANGNPVTSGCAASGCQLHSFTGTATPNRIPMLKVSPSATGEILSWPAVNSDYVLEESSNMITWYPAIWPMVTNSTTISAQISGQGPNVFFRLHQK